MKKILKNTMLFFMLIAGLVIFSHSLIPHDHHYNLVDNLVDEHHNNQENKPFHCHFLDYVIADAAIQKTVIQKIVLQPVLFVVLSDFNSEKKLNKQTHFIKSENKLNLLTIIKIFPTRGSPSFS